MKINNLVLSIPPYISTSWRNVSSIYINEDKNLVITLTSKEKIFIPNLEKETIKLIFDAHVKHLEEKHLEGNKSFIPKMGTTLKFPLSLQNLDGIGPIGNLMQHDSSLMNAPNLPKEVLNKIASISKIMDLEKSSDIAPKAEPHCNCPHCQIARAIRGEKKKKLDEEVTEKDLQFRTWDIKQTGDKLYQVINPLEENEKYNVYLGKPLGCTCGQKNCVHIKAVLES